MEKNDIMDKLQISYPCQWLYKVIGFDRKQLHQALLEVVGNKPCTISFSNSSSTGKYHCFNFEIIVKSEEERDAVYMSLNKHPQVVKVL